MLGLGLELGLELGLGLGLGLVLGLVLGLGKQRMRPTSYSASAWGSIPLRQPGQGQGGVTVRVRDRVRVRVREGLATSISFSGLSKARLKRVTRRGQSV